AVGQRLEPVVHELVVDPLRRRIERGQHLGPDGHRAARARQRVTTWARTSSTVIACMQRLSRQADWRVFRALMQGLHAIPAESATLWGERVAKSSGVSGPKSVITSIGVSAAKCAGPLSFVTRTSPRV